MKVGIVGVGFMGTTHAAGWAETPAEIVGFTAETQQEAGSIAAQYQARIYPSLEEMLPDVDVVDICSPTHLHCEMALKAAAAGKHVICEKPLARTTQQAQKIVKACQEAGVLRSAPPELMAVSVWGQVYGVIALALEGQISHTVLDRFGIRDIVLFGIEQMSLSKV